MILATTLGLGYVNQGTILASVVDISLWFKFVYG